jgi:hypothetical protein
MNSEVLVALPPIVSAVAWPTAPYAPGTAFVTSIYSPGTQIVPRYAWQTQIDQAADILAVQQARVNEQEALRAEGARPRSSSSPPRSTVSSSRMGMRIQKGWKKFQASTEEDRRLAAEAMAPVKDLEEDAVDTEEEAAAAVRRTRIGAGLLIGAAVGLFLALR